MTDTPNYIHIQIKQKNKQNTLNIICDAPKLKNIKTWTPETISGDKILKLIQNTEEYYIFYKNTPFPKKLLTKFIKNDKKYLITNISKASWYSNMPNASFCEAKTIKIITENVYDNFKSKLRRKYAVKRISSKQFKTFRGINNRFIIDNTIIHHMTTHVNKYYYDWIIEGRKYITINPKLIELIPLITRHYASIDIEPISIEAAMKFANISTKKCEKYLKKLTQNNFNILLLGLGGVGNSFLYWLNELLKYFNIKEPIFNNLILIDGDIVEYHNLYRLPFWNSDIELNDKDQTLSKIEMTIQTLKLNNAEYMYKNIHSINKFIESKEDLDDILNIVNDDLIIYGAPTISTRQMLCIEQQNKKFNIAYSLNQNNVATLGWNTDYSENLELANETYGTLNVSTFLLNQLAITYKFIESIAINKYEDTEIKTLEMDKEINSKTILGLKYYY